MSASDVPSAFLSALTRHAGKAEEYARDPHARRGWQAARDVPDALELIHRRVLVVLKPDAIAGRRSSRLLDTMEERGFRVLASQPFTFTPLLTRELWRFQFNIASTDRGRVVDILLPAGPSVALVLEHPERNEGLPAACLLNSLKGPADPALRRPDDLRSILQSPTTLFNFMHAADEPADVLRECALIDLAADLRLLPALLADSSESADVQARAHVADAEALIPEHDLDAAASWRRLAARRTTVAIEPPTTLDELARRCGARPRTDEVWDYLSVATAVIDSNVAGLEPLIPTVGAAAWRESSIA